MRVRQLAAEIFKTLIQSTTLVSKGLPDRRYLKEFAEWSWDAASAFEERAQWLGSGESGDDIDDNGAA